LAAAEMMSGVSRRTTAAVGWSGVMPPSAVPGSVSSKGGSGILIAAALRPTLTAAFLLSRRASPGR